VEEGGDGGSGAEGVGGGVVGGGEEGGGKTVTATVTPETSHGVMVSLAALTT